MMLNVIIAHDVDVVVVTAIVVYDALVVDAFAVAVALTVILVVDDVIVSNTRADIF